MVLPITKLVWNLARSDFQSGSDNGTQPSSPSSPADHTKSPSPLPTIDNAQLTPPPPSATEVDHGSPPVANTLKRCLLCFLLHFQMRSRNVETLRISE